MRRFLAAAFPAALALAACGPTEFEPASAGLGDTGYRTSQISQDRYLVSFEGGPSTSRQTVETYLLYRAAQVASEAGAPYFALVEEDVEREVDVNAYTATPGLYGYGAGFGLSPGFGYPYSSTWRFGRVGPAVTTTDSYSAYATVELLESRPEGRGDVFDTDEVLTTLRPQIEFPDA